MEFDEFQQHVVAAGLKATKITERQWQIRGQFRKVLFVVGPPGGHHFYVTPTRRLTLKGSLAEAIEAAQELPLGGRKSQTGRGPGGTTKTKARHVPKNTRRRKALWERDRAICHWCLRTLRFADATVDHLLKIGELGREHIDYQVVSCAPCNSMRGHRNPIEFRRLRRAMTTQQCTWSAG